MGTRRFEREFHLFRRQCQEHCRAGTFFDADATKALERNEGSPIEQVLAVATADSSLRAKAADLRYADPFEVLGVASDASTSEIQAAYKKLSLKCDPDKTQHRGVDATAEFKLLKKAYDAIMGGRAVHTGQTAAWGKRSSATTPPPKAKAKVGRPTPATRSSGAARSGTPSPGQPSSGWRHEEPRRGPDDQGSAPQMNRMPAPKFRRLKKAYVATMGGRAVHTGQTAAWGKRSSATTPPPKAKPKVGRPTPATSSSGASARLCSADFAPQTSGPAHASAADLGAQPKEPVRDALAAPQDEEEAAEEAWSDASDEIDFGDADDQDHPPQDAQDDPPRDDQDDPPQGKDIGRFRRQGLPCRALVNRQGDMFQLSSSTFVDDAIAHILDTRRPFLIAEDLHNETDRLTKDSQMQIKAILCRKSRVWQPFLAATKEQLRRSSK